MRKLKKTLRAIFYTEYQCQWKYSMRIRKCSSVRFAKDEMKGKNKTDDSVQIVKMIAWKYGFWISY